MTLLYLCLVSCGENATSNVGGSADTAEIQTTDLVAVTSLYSEDFPDGIIEKIDYQDRTVIVTLLDDNNQASLYRINIDTGGTEVCSVGDWTSSTYCMGNSEDLIWRLRPEYTWIDKENYQADCQYYLERMNQKGDIKATVLPEKNLYPREWVVDEDGGIWCVAIDLTGNLDSKLYHFAADGTTLLDIGATEADIDFDSINDICLSTDGTLLVLTDDYLSFWKDDVMLSKSDAGPGSLIEAPSGLYWAATGAEDSLFPIDLETHSIGASVSSLYGASDVYTGDGIYDCILVTAEKVLGLNIAEGATELYDSPVTNMTLLDFICAIDGDTLLMSTHSGLTWSYVLTQIDMMDENSVPERKPLILATVSGSTQFYCFDEWISYYNQHSTEYQVQVVEYEDEAALALALSTGEQIDILAWGSESGFYKRCWQRGYLKSLYDFTDADEKLSDLILAYRLCAEEPDGGLYRISSSIGLYMLVGRTSYVGNAGNLSSSDLKDFAESLPENMNLMDGGWETALRSFLSLNQFVDYENESCNFTCQEFYDLLTLIQTQFTEHGRSYADVGEYISEQAAVQSVSIQGIYDFWLEALAANEFTPLSISNLGTKVTFEDSYSITTASEHPEAAWDFIQIMLSYDVQKYPVFLPVNQCVMDNRILGALENENIDITVAEQIQTLLEGTLYLGYTDETIFGIVYEEAQACFLGEKSPEEVAQVIQSRCNIYLSEQS